MKHSYRNLGLLVGIFVLFFSLIFFAFSPSKATAQDLTPDVSWSISETGGFNNLRDDSGIISNQGNKVIHYVVHVVNHGPGVIEVQKNAYTDPIAGWAPTIANENQSIFQMTGKTVYAEGESGDVEFTFDTAQLSCGRVQLDAGFVDKVGGVFVFIGAMVNYGVDCVTPPTVCNEKATLSVTQALPATLSVGQTYPFTIHVTNTGNTKWYNGSFFQLIKTTGNLAISPVYGHLPYVVYPGDSVDWTFNVTTPTTTGAYSASFQMVHTAFADFMKADGSTCPPPSTDIFFGNQVTVTGNVPVVVPTPTVTLLANPTSVAYNASSTLSWTSTNTTACTASNGWTGVKAVAGSEVQNSLTSNKTYVIVCTGPGGSATSTASVVVAPAPAPTVNLVANPISVLSGSSSTLSWTSTNSTTCVASGDWSGTKTINGSEVQNNLTSNKSYTIVCTGLGGSATSTANVGVGALPPSVILTADPVSVAYNASSTLIWTSTNATSCVASGSWSGNKSLSGSEVQNNLTSNKTYTIVCTGLGGSATSTANVTVGAQAPTVVLTASPSSVAYNASSTLSWTSTNATACTASNGWSGVKAINGSEIQNNLTSNKTYTIVCTGLGGTATSTATVTVGNEPTTPTNQCMLPDTLGDVTPVVFGASPEQTTQNIITTAGLTVSSQKEYQVWNTNTSSTTIEIKFLNGVTAAGDVFGYYKKGQPNTFVPLFKFGFGTNAAFGSVATATPGQVYSISVPAGDYAFAIHSDVGATSFWSTENGLNTSGEDHVATYDVVNSNNTLSGSYVLAFEDVALPSSDSDFNDIVVQITVKSCENITTPQNHPPVITLIGANPASVTQGDTYLDPGATAFDQEDGDITSHIIVSGSVNVNVPGSYILTYNVSDSQGLPAVPVSRTVNVLERTPVVKGNLRVCMVIADNQNVIATSSSHLPAGTFTLRVATSTNIATSTIQTQTWNAASFAPNTRIILPSLNDAHCVTYTNLDLGVYYYSELAVTGSLWNTPKYNDEFNHPVNSVFDFFPYSPELFNATTSDDSLRDENADGVVTLSADHRERTVFVFDTYNPAPQCMLPAITSPLTAQVNVGQAFSYTLTGTATSTLGVATSTLPAGLTFATSTNTISGTPTEVGTYNITLTAQNTCGLDTQTLVLTVLAVTGGGGGSTPTANLTLTKTADKTSVNPGDTVTYTLALKNNGPDTATGISITDVLPSTLTFVSATTTLGTFSTSTNIWTVDSLLNGSTTTMTLVATVNSGTFGQKITNTGVAHATQNDPNSGDNTSSVDVNVNPAPSTGCTSNCGGGGGGGGNGPIVGSLPGPSNPQVAGASTVKACYYLYDYLRKDFNNNPVEVRKLQIFLRDLEGFTTVQITGIYDDQTIVALNAFQNRYKADILTPWGHTAPTSYTYILTKKKVNEIYCKMAFPVTSQQQEEIDAFRNFLLSLHNAGITLPTNTNSGEQNNTGAVIGGNVVGSATSTATSTKPSSGLSTLAGVSSTTQKIAGSLVANVLSAGKRFVGFLGSLFVWPFGSVFSKANQCIVGYGVFGWLNLILILVILLVLYLWYRQYKNNKKLEIINKEIDLS